MLQSRQPLWKKRSELNIRHRQKVLALCSKVYQKFFFPCLPLKKQYINHTVGLNTSDKACKQRKVCQTSSKASSTAFGIFRLVHGCNATRFSSGLNSDMKRPLFKIHIPCKTWKAVQKEGTVWVQKQWALIKRSDNDMNNDIKALLWGSPTSKIKANSILITYVYCTFLFHTLGRFSSVMWVHHLHHRSAKS